jgi:copper chaperone CopZ
MMNTTPRTFVGTTTFQVRGMTCAHCERAVVSAVSALDGVHGVAIELPAGLVTIRVDRPVDRADVAAAIADAGHAVVP